MSGKVQNLASMSDAELRAFLFDDDDYSKMNFIQATTAYITAMNETEASTMKTISETMNTETEMQSGFTEMDKSLNDAYVKALEAEPSAPSGMPDWLNDLVSGLTAVLSILTFNPVMIGMSFAMFAMNFQVSGKSLMSMMEDQMFSKDDYKDRAAFEFGFALGMAAAGGAVSASSMGSTAAQASENAALAETSTAEEMEMSVMRSASGAAADVEAAETSETASAANAKDISSTQTQRLGDFMSTWGKFTAQYLGMTLMQDGFWNDFFQGPCGMDSEDAAIAGMFAGIAFAGFSSYKCATSEDGLTTALRDKLTQMGPKGQFYLRLLTVGLNLIGDGFRLGSGIEEIKIASQYNDLGDFIKNVLAPALSKLTFVQGLSQGMNSMSTLTQASLQSATDTAGMVNQTFAAFGHMWDEN